MLRRGINRVSTSAPSCTTTTTTRACCSLLGFCNYSSVFAATMHHTQRSFHSLSLEQAMRITSPSPKHPATGEKSTEGPHDPQTVWREHWDVEFERPYYHNLVTNEVRTTLPEGFPTRFQFFYRKKYGGIKHEPSDAGALPKHATRAQSVKERIKEFGLAGFLLYGVIHFGCLGIVFVVMLSGVDVTGILKSFGLEAHRAHGQSIWAVFLAAVVTNKIFVPLQAFLTLALAPKAAPLIRSLLARIGIKAQ